MLNKRSVEDIFKELLKSQCYCCSINCPYSIYSLSLQVYKVVINVAERRTFNGLHICPTFTVHSLSLSPRQCNHPGCPRRVHEKYILHRLCFSRRRLNAGRRTRQRQSDPSKLTNTTRRRKGTYHFAKRGLGSSKRCRRYQKCFFQ